jgi:hypothetical protein
VIHLSAVECETGRDLQVRRECAARPERCMGEGRITWILQDAIGIDDLPERAFVAPGVRVGAFGCDPIGATQLSGGRRRANAQHLAGVFWRHVRCGPTHERRG